MHGEVYSFFPLLEIILATILLRIRPIVDSELKQSYRDSGESENQTPSHHHDLALACVSIQSDNGLEGL
jgi:hypothetical protein